MLKMSSAYIIAEIFFKGSTSFVLGMIFFCWSIFDFKVAA